MDIDPAKALRGRLIAVVNTGSGGAGGDAADRMRGLFAEAGLTGAEVVSVGPAGVDRALSDAAARADVVVVLGGDGTIRGAAETCGHTGRPLIPLAGGTMNMLAHALYGQTSWETALTRTLAAPRLRAVSGGRANGQAFFCAAILGAPTLWADVREAVRRVDVVTALRRSITALRRGSESLDYWLGDLSSGSAEAVAVLCPLVSRVLGADEGTFEAAAMEPIAAGAIFSLAFHAVFDDWRHDSSVSLASVRAVRVAGHGRVPVILDGEKARFGRTVSLTFVPAAFHAIVPAEAVE
jgi:diacylglycerol kinase family enzyme